MALGALYLVATPIGNLEDLTPRAARTLAAVARIACEDTRQTAKLLARYEIRRPLVSYHEHNERQRAAQLLTLLLAGEDIALVSDAGMPLISDPGQELVQAAIAHGIAVIPIPGPSAVLAALAASGLATQPFCFTGFAPARATARRRLFASWREKIETIVFYEAPHRLRAALADLEETVGAQRRLAVARELTKRHEEIVRGSIGEIAGHFRSQEPRGEFTLVLAGASPGAALPSAPDSELAARMRELLAQGSDVKQALKLVARELGLSRSEAYRRWQIAAE